MSAFRSTGLPVLLAALSACGSLSVIDDSIGTEKTSTRTQAVAAPDATQATVVNVKDLATRASTRPTGEVPGLVHEHAVPSRPAAAPARTTAQPDAVAPEAAASVLSSAAPTALTQLVDFEGQGQTEWIPPDTNGAVSPKFVVTTVNNRMTVRDRSGNFVTSVHLNDFWAGLPTTTDSFDTRSRFDPYGHRFIVMSAGSLGDTPNSGILIGVTQTDDPTANWFTFRVKADALSLNWADYPTLGFNRNWIAVSANMFGPEFFTRVWAFDKAALYSGTLRVTVLPGIGVTAQPAETYDPNIQDLYFLQQFGGNSVALYRLTGPVASPHTEFIATIFPPLGWSDPPDAPQLGTNARIASGIPWMMDAVYRNGSIWGSQEVQPVGGPQRSAVQFLAVSPQGALEEFGRIDDPNGVYYYGMASIGVNASDDVLIGYTRFSADTYPSTGYTLRPLGAPAFSPTVIYKAGGGPYLGGRWGDFSHTMADPTNDTDLWTVQEYSPGDGGWGTWWAAVSPEPGPGANLAVRLKSSPITNNTNSPHPFFQIVNLGPAPIPLNELAIRYWFDCDCSPTTVLQSWVDWAGILPSGQPITQSTHSSFVTTTASGQTHALEVTFVGGQLLNPNETVQVETRFNTASWDQMQQFDDWSFEPFSTYRPAPDVTVYLRGNLVAGREP